MLRSLNDLLNYTVAAIDGPIGEVKDLYFDDQAWMTRYLVVDTGSWLSRRKVLISPSSIEHVDDAVQALSVTLTRKQVEDSPPIDTDKPVSRQHEHELRRHYGYPRYWGGGALLGMAPLTGVGSVAAPSAGGTGGLGLFDDVDEIQHRDDDDPNLRSGWAIRGYTVAATDGDLGHIEGLLVGEDDWAVRYLVINTSNWWMGHTLLVAPQWIEGISWASGNVSVDLSRETLKNAPPYDADVAVDRQQEIDLYCYYGRAAYWSGA
jgi:hypothetical protein